MLHKNCPWYGKKVLLAHLGKKLSKVPPKWHGLTRYNAVCPHCGGMVKKSRAGQNWLLLLIPLCGLIFFDLITVQKTWQVTNLHWAFLLLGSIGIVLSDFLIEDE